MHSKLSKENAIAIKAFNTRNLQLAEYPCISCALKEMLQN